VTTMTEAAPRRRVLVHPLLVRLTHWINVYAIGCMLMSGLEIYNASPLWGFRFPAWMTLGGWLGAATIWHFAAMWLLLGNGLIYACYGLLSGHFRRHFLPLRAADILSDARAAARLRLPHRLGHYNAVQRLAYVVALGLGVLAVLSGLALWKPVQLDGLTALFGGYDFARRVHFLVMAGIVGFILLHLALVALVPRTLAPMIIGTARDPGDDA
jgi:thiosulfate reductase cytochrome b subunit